MNIMSYEFISHIHTHILLLNQISGEFSVSITRQQMFFCYVSYVHSINVTVDCIRIHIYTNIYCVCVLGWVICNTYIHYSYVIHIFTIAYVLYQGIPTIQHMCYISVPQLCSIAIILGYSNYIAYVLYQGIPTIQQRYYIIRFVVKSEFRHTLISMKCG